MKDETRKALANAAKAFVGDAQEAFTVSSDVAEITVSTAALRELLKEWQARNKMVEQAIVGLLKLVRQNCKHVGAERGYNDRDGVWMCPCPTCGHSE